MSALTRSRRSLLGTCSEAIQTGVPVDSKRRRSCSRTSASVRYVARTESSGALDCWDRTVPKTTSPTPSAAATATRTIAVLMRLVRRELPALVHVPGPDAGGHGDRDPSLGDREEGDIAVAEEVTRRGDEVGGHRAARRDVDLGALARDVLDHGEGLRRGGLEVRDREVAGLDHRPSLDIVARHHDLDAGGTALDERQACDPGGGDEGEHRQHCSDHDVKAPAPRSGEGGGGY